MWNSDIKDTWFNELKCYLAYHMAKLYQKSWPILSVPVIGEPIMTLLWKISDFISPFPTMEGCLNPIMLEVIRERMGIPDEEFNQKLEEIRKNSEREELGLPPV